MCQEAVQKEGPEVGIERGVGIPGERRVQIPEEGAPPLDAACSIGDEVGRVGRLGVDAPPLRQGFQLVRFAEQSFSGEDVRIGIKARRLSRRICSCERDENER